MDALFCPGPEVVRRHAGRRASPQLALRIRRPEVRILLGPLRSMAYVCQENFLVRRITFPLRSMSQNAKEKRELNERVLIGPQAFALRLFHLFK